MNASALAIQPLHEPTSPTRQIHGNGSTPEALQDVASGEFIHAMRGAATGVNIVTTDGPAGRFGLTVSAFVSVSAEPPMVLICINRRSPACAAVRGNRRFCVNVLAKTQRETADTFAGRPTTGKAYEFHAGSWKGSATGSPVLDGGVASFDCALERVINAGTHTIFIGTVKAVESSGKSPLVYTDGTYRRTGPKA